MTATYLLQQTGYAPRHAPEYVVITLPAISKWMIKKDNHLAAQLRKMSQGIKGKLANPRIHPEWVKEKSTIQRTGDEFFSAT